jgi:uncharacterized membrane protein ArfC
VNWWLMAVAFVLGLVLTGLFMVRRVPVAAPVTESHAPAASNFTSTGDEDEEPYGVGSFRGATPPSGYTVKGNDESKLYHSPESPSYGVTRAEVWFRDVETAEAAGFHRWDSGKSQRGK